MNTTNRRRHFALPFAFIVLATTALAGPDERFDQNRSATQVATAWFASLTQGETAVTTSLSAAPFLVDGDREIKTLTELKKFYDKIVEKKGKRNLELTSVRIESSSPQRIVVILMIEGDDEAVAVSIEPGEAFRVVGFTD